MAEAVSSLVAIDWSIPSVVIGAIEEPIDDAAYVDADAINTGDSKDAVSPDVGQPKEVVVEFLGKSGVRKHEPEFAEPDQRRRRSR